MAVGHTVSSEIGPLQVNGAQPSDPPPEKTVAPPWQLLLYAVASLLFGVSPLLAAAYGPEIMMAVLIVITAPVGFFFALCFGLAAALRRLGGLPNKGRLTSGRRQVAFHSPAVSLEIVG